jgi:AcrR family transcriptional regulator
MQVKKENIKNKILQAARQEFKAKNYEKASIRTIAEKAGVTPSNIYNYFEKKDDLFRTVLQPLINKIEIGKKVLNKFEFDREPGVQEDLDSHHEIIINSAKIVDENREDMKILVFKSKGSSVENYIDSLTDWFTGEFKKSLCEKAQYEVDGFLVHIMSSIWFNSIREILMHDIKGERMMNIAEDLMTFIFTGWRNLMEEKNIDCH